MTLQYCLLVKDSKDGLLEAASDFTPDSASAINDAFFLSKKNNTDYSVHSIIRINIETCESSTFLTRDQLWEMFEAKEENND